MARRYRYAFAKKREAARGKLSVGLAAASFGLFAAAVVLELFLDGNERAYWRYRLFCNASFCIRLRNGAVKFFGRKQKTQNQHDRVHLKRCDHGYLAGTFFIRSMIRWMKKNV